MLFLVLGQPLSVRANPKYYQYDGKLPFVEMMLNMMVVMGILDKIPPQYMNNAYNPYGSRYGNYAYLNNPVLRNALLKRGINPMALNSLGGNSLGMNPLSMGAMGSPMAWNSLGINPFSLNSSGLNPLALNSLGLNSLGLNRYGLTGLNNRYPGYLNRRNLNNLALNQLRLDQQVSPWASSPWDNALTGSFPSSSITDEPFIDEDVFQYSYNDDPYFKRTYKRRKSRYSPLSKYAGSSRARERRVSSPLARLSDHGQRREYSDEDYEAAYSDEPYAKERWREEEAFDRNYVEDSPCVTELCGLGKYTRPPAYANIPDIADAPVFLDGLWVTDTGEMLGIKKQRFLWSDGNSRYLTGTIQALQDILIAKVDGKETVMNFQYRLDENRLLTQGPDGQVRVFNRVPVQGI